MPNLPLPPDSTQRATRRVESPWRRRSRVAGWLRKLGRGRRAGGQRPGPARRHEPNFGRLVLVLVGAAVGFAGAATFHMAAAQFPQQGVGTAALRAGGCLVVLLVVALMARRRAG